MKCLVNCCEVPKRGIHEHPNQILKVEAHTSKTKQFSIMRYTRDMKIFSRLFWMKFLRTIVELDALVPRIHSALATIERTNLYSLNQLNESSRGKFSNRYTLRAVRGVAHDSLDNMHPKGAISDITHSPAFVSTAERIFKDNFKFLDLGCAGGGLVYDFLRKGHEAYGLEGSDIPINADFGFWPLLGNNHLYTCDITKPWFFEEVRRKQKVSKIKFDLISAWEVLEHIAEMNTGSLMQNIKENLSQEGFFIGSVATFPSIEKISGVDLHVNKNPKKWWAERFQEYGLRLLSDDETYSLFPSWSLARGAGNRTSVDWHFRESKGNGFHVCATHSENSPHI
jgi:2-polyprenyl-3-methyl-5-hydroxy-6-metoxy-1,4-benzoquinol methylase